MIIFDIQHPGHRCVLADQMLPDHDKDLIKPKGEEFIWRPDLYSFPIRISYGHIFYEDFDCI